MKITRIFVAAAAALALAGCAKENQPETVPGQDSAADVAGKTITFEASLGADAKTTLGDLAEGKRPVYWESADKLAAVAGSSTLYSGLAVEIDDENRKKCTFSIVDMTEPSEEDNLIFFYPSQGASAAEGGVKFTLSAVQVGPANGLPKTSGSYNPLAAAVADAGNALDVYNNGGSSVTFRNVFGLLAFQFPSADIKQVVFEGNDGETVAGTYVITAAGALTDASSISESVTLKTSDGNAFKAGYTYYMAVAPQDFEKGFTLTFTTTDGLTYQKTTDKPLSLSASDIINLGEFKNAGITDVARLWGVYNKPTTTQSNWWTSINNFPGSNETNNRNIALDDNYVYMSDTGKGYVYAFNISDGSYSHTLSKLDSNGTGIVSGGTFTVCDVDVIDNDGSSVVLVANFINNNASQVLKVYSYESSTGSASLSLSYSINATGYRLGDKFSIEGDWNSGKIMFYNAMGIHDMLIFDIENGQISQTPTKVTLGALSNTYSAMYKFNEEDYLLAGAGGNAYVYSKSGNTFTQGYKCETYPNPVLEPNFFVYNGRKYMAYVSLDNSYQDGSLRIAEMDSSDLATSIKNSDSKQFIKGLGDPEEMNITAVKNSNGVGGCAVREVSGRTLVAACVPGSGLSLFELK